MNQYPLSIPCYCGHVQAQCIKEVPYQKEQFTQKFGTAKILKCNQCGMLRTSPSPLLISPDFYQDENVSHSHEKNIELWKQFSKEIVDNIKKYKVSGRLLDIGCNIGIFVNQAKEAGFNAEGIDLNQSATEFGRNQLGANIRCQSLESIPGENLFDVITMNHVIEHIQDLDSFFTHVKRLLKKDGIFFSACPNAESYIVKTLNLLNQRKSGKGSQWFWYGYLPEEHVWQFGPKSLLNVLNHSGLKVVDCNAHQNMHWGATSNQGLRFKIMFLLWNFFKLINKGDNLFIFAKKID